MSELEELWERYILERPRYELLAERVQRELRLEMRKRGVACEVQARAKDVDQFVKKILRKSYSEYEQVTDKAGARVVVRFYSHLEDVDAAIRELFEVKGFENKRSGLGYDKLGYLGIHFDVLVAPEAPDVVEDTEAEPLACEIQVQTSAQHLWADMSHDLLYKQEFEPPEELQRSVYRLVALAEVFDEQLASAREAMMTRPDFHVARMLADLEAVYYRFTPRPFDKELSKLLLRRLAGLYDDSETRGFSELVEGFVETNRAKIDSIYSSYGGDPRANPLLFQPETLAVFERLGHDAFRLKEAWITTLPIDWLQKLAAIWGVAV